VASSSESEANVAAVEGQPENRPAVPFSNRITRILDNRVIASAIGDPEEPATSLGQESESACDLLSNVLTRELSPNVSTQDSHAHEVILEALIAAYAPSTPSEVTLIHLLASDLAQLKQVKDLVNELQRPPEFGGRDIWSLYQLRMRRQALSITEQILKRDPKHSPGCTRAQAIRVAAQLAERFEFIESKIDPWVDDPEDLKRASEGEVYEVDGRILTPKEVVEEHKRLRQQVQIPLQRVWDVIVPYKKQMIDCEYLTAVLCGEATPCAEERRALQTLLIDWEESARKLLYDDNQLEINVHQKFQKRRLSVSQTPKLLITPNKRIGTLEKAILQKINMLDRTCIQTGFAPVQSTSVVRAAVRARDLNPTLFVSRRCLPKRW